MNMYCDIFMFRLRAAYDHRAMERAVARAVARHEILRTTFDFNGYSQPLQLVHSEAVAQVQAHDLRDLAPAEQEAALDAWQLADRKVGYDWANPPLMRFTVHELADEEFMFSMSFHDALLDGWSESSLITEILADYWALRDGGEKDPAPQPVRRYADFIALEREALADQGIKDFWRQELDETGPTLLPAWSRGPRTGTREPWASSASTSTPRCPRRWTRSPATTACPSSTSCWPRTPGCCPSSPARARSSSESSPTAAPRRRAAPT